MATEEPGPTPSPGPQKRPLRFLRQLARTPPGKRPATLARQISDIMELPFLLVASVAIGGGLGFLLDKRIHTSPVFTLIFGMLGFAGGMVQLVRRLLKDTNDDGGG